MPIQTLRKLSSSFQPTSHHLSKFIKKRHSPDFPTGATFSSPAAWSLGSAFVFSLACTIPAVLQQLLNSSDSSSGKDLQHSQGSDSGWEGEKSPRLPSHTAFLVFLYVQHRQN